MKDRLVLDASVAVSWCLAEPETFERARAVLIALKKVKAVVPANWQAEVANVLVVRERQKRIDEATVRKFVKQMQDLPVEVDAAAATEAFDAALTLARRHHLSVYDACYLEVAIREKAALATFDTALREAARRDAVELFDAAPT